MNRQMCVTLPIRVLAPLLLTAYSTAAPAAAISLTPASGSPLPIVAYSVAIADVNSDLQIRSPQVMVDIERDRALALNVTPEQIQNALYTAYGNRQVSTIYTPANEYAVITEVEPQYQRSPDALSRLRCLQPASGAEHCRQYH